MNIWGYESKLKVQKSERAKLDKEINNLEDRLYFARNSHSRFMKLHKEDKETIEVSVAEDMLAGMKIKFNHLSNRIRYNEDMIEKERNKKKVRKK